jgi:hypothetical protein
MSAVELLGQFTRNVAQTAELFYGDDIKGVVHVFATTTARDAIPGATFRTGELCVIQADDSKWKWDGSAWVAYTGFGNPNALLKDGSVGLTADWAAGAHDITVTQDPGSANALTRKSYVDAAVASALSTVLDWKQSVRAATTAALPSNTLSGNVLTATANGALPAQDGVTLALGERLLVKDEATGANRGIFTVTALGSGGAPWTLTRATDADSSAEVTAGLGLTVTEGTVNGGKIFLLTTPDPIVLNTTSLTFTALQGVTADGTTLTQTGSVLSVAAGGIGATQVADGSLTPAKMVSGKATFDVLGVDVATTGNVTLSGVPANIDAGYTLVNGVSRILVWLNTAAGENGIYLYNSGGAWTRVTDLATGADFRPMVPFPIKAGTLFGGKSAWSVNTTPPTVGVTDIIFEVSYTITQPTTKGGMPTWDGSKFVVTGLKTRVVDLGDADTSVDVTEGSRFVLSVPTTSSRALTLLNTGASDGWCVLIECAVVIAFAYVIKNAAGTPLITLPAGGKYLASCKFTSVWTKQGFTELG